MTMNTSAHSMLAFTWFALIGLMLVFYVVTDGFDLGVGMLTLLKRTRDERDVMVETIGHVWDANETWLVVVGGALFGAFPAAYALLMQSLYVPVMTMIAGLIMRGAAIEFRHGDRHGPAWDTVFGAGSLVAAISQGVMLGRIVTGLAPGAFGVAFSGVAALGVVTGYALLGATYVAKKTVGPLEQWARRIALLCAVLTVAAAAVLTAATWAGSAVGRERWLEPGVLPVLAALALCAALSFAWLVASLYLGSVRGPFRAAVALFVVSFTGLAVSVYPDFVPGRLAILAASSDTATLVFMLIGIGFIFPVMIGYNLYQYSVFRGKVTGTARAGD